MLFSGRIRVRILVSKLVRVYVHVFIQLSVVIVTLLVFYMLCLDLFGRAFLKRPRVWHR